MWIERIADSAIQRDKGRLIERLEPFLGFMEQGIAAVGSLAVVPFDRVGQSAFGQPKFLLDLFPGFADGRYIDAGEFRRSFEDGVVSQQENAITGLLHDMMANTPVIAVLIDEALATFIDEDPLHQ
ncbi:hypothetical protein D9M69_608160 [compost metagenome]